MIALNEAHVRRLGREFIAYYHEDRTHLGLDKDTPSERPIEGKAEGAELESPARVGGLHHQYESSRVNMTEIPKAPQGRSPPVCSSVSFAGGTPHFALLRVLRRFPGVTHPCFPEMTRWHWKPLAV